LTSHLAKLTEETRQEIWSEIKIDDEVAGESELAVMKFVRVRVNEDFLTLFMLYTVTFVSKEH